MDIEVINLSKRFGDHQVLDNLNLTFKKGQINCIMGESGSGKTTLLNIIMGLIKADSGTIKGVSNKNLTAVFQEDRLIEHFNAYENIKLVSPKDISTEFSKEKVEEELEKVNLSLEHDKVVRDYSGGMKRRLAIVRAFIPPSDLIILDEPFKGLDAKIKEKVMKYILEGKKERTIIMVTHNRDDVKWFNANLVNIK